MVGLYPDWKNGVISQEEYLTLKADLQAKLDTLDSSISKLQLTAEQYAGGLEHENEFLAHFRKYHNFTELTRPMLTELVNEIRVYEGGRLEMNHSPAFWAQVERVLPDYRKIREWLKEHEKELIGRL